MSGMAMSSSTDSGVTEPPYWMRTASAVSWSYILASHPRMKACTDCAVSLSQTSPVPMAHTCAAPHIT